ncbi:hypothetical protein TraAM80_01618 [Trypanosoma rangeli]|uniref:Uncharacterized protein n=1 Tax=Trypanosoma rangeli TaxID=5698 RepID=A0A422NXW8_TRYRA|nr:uncharacterized protein TraAM80_01618 [Trypanosoma rangeli]RNF10275.1 hypothetical protein TraAM80_01618 [Trypanosoma rangeli]|eukprot:RNF10275.1 hypothetical protein TraAM80_01618 [Trypanosoma rangeli]
MAAWAAVGVMLFLFGAFSALVMVVASWSRRWHVHASVAVAILPLAALLTLGFTVSAQKLVEYIHETAQLNVVPSLLSYMLQRVRPIAGDAITLLDIQLVAILLFISYASMVLLRHLVDISRLLKVSRRRIFMK